MRRQRIDRLALVGEQLGELLVPPVTRLVGVAQHRLRHRDRFDLGLARVRWLHRKRSQRVPRQPEPVRAPEEPSDRLDGDDLCATLGNELAKGVVQQQVGAVGGYGAPLGVDGACGRRQPGHRVRQIGGTGHEGGGQRPSQRRRGAPGPEEQTHDDAHTTPDGDVFDPGQSHLPADRLDDVEQDDHRQGEGTLPRCEADHRRCHARNEDGRREQHPQQDRVVRDAHHDGGADDHSERGAPDGAQGGRAGAKSIGSQDRQRAQDNPEPVLDVRDLDDGDGDGETDGAPHGVAKPDRPERHVGEDPVQVDAGRLADHAHTLIEQAFGPCRFQRGVGHHLGGDAERPGVKTRVPRRCDVVVRRP